MTVRRQIISRAQRSHLAIVSGRPDIDPENMVGRVAGNPGRN
ncbi:hypothetical protein MMEU_2894 [Mycobacterium marinum str. Europe]|nr:hypothetical protein MMEU_2894 [Mycobacterium marinum str. Europe]